MKKQQFTVNVANGIGTRTSANKYTHCVVFTPSAASHEMEKSYRREGIAYLEKDIATSEENVAWFKATGNPVRTTEYGLVFSLKVEEGHLARSKSGLEYEKAELAGLESIDYTQAKGRAISWHSSEALARKALGSHSGPDYSVVAVNEGSTK